ARSRRLEEIRYGWLIRSGRSNVASPASAHHQGASPTAVVVARHTSGRGAAMSTEMLMSVVMSDSRVRHCPQPSRESRRARRPGVQFHHPSPAAHPPVTSPARGGDPHLIMHRNEDPRRLVFIRAGRAPAGGTRTSPPNRPALGENL